MRLLVHVQQMTDDKTGTDSVSRGPSAIHELLAHPTYYPNLGTFRS